LYRARVLEESGRSGC